MGRMLDALKQLDARLPRPQPPDRPPPEPLDAADSLELDLRDPAADIRTGEEVGGGLSQFSSDENGTVPLPRAESACLTDAAMARVLSVAEPFEHDAVPTPQVAAAAEQPSALADKPPVAPGSSSSPPREVPCGPSCRALDQLADRVLSQLPPGAPAVLMFSGADDGASKTNMVAMLAETLVYRVAGEALLIDGDRDASRLARHFNVEVEAVSGWGDVLRGRVDWAEAVCATGVPRLSLLPGKNRFAGPDRLPQEADLRRLIEELRGRFRLVLIDTGSPTDADVRAAARCCDGVYLVVRLGRISRRALLRSVRLITQGGGRLCGCVALGG